MYITVIRLYNKHELSLGYNGSDKFYDRLKQQYDYAKENLNSQSKALSRNSAENGVESY
jgi:hypothetical protein